MALDRELSPQASSGRQTVQRPPDPPKYRGRPPACTNPDPLRHGLLAHADTHRRRHPAPGPVQPQPQLTAAVCSGRVESAGWVDSPCPYRNEAHPAPFHLLPHTEGRALEENPASRYDSSVPTDSGAAPTHPPWEDLAWGVGPRACPHSFTGSVTVPGFNRAERRRPTEQEEPRHGDLSTPSP